MISITVVINSVVDLFPFFLFSVKNIPACFLGSAQSQSSAMVKKVLRYVPTYARYNTYNFKLLIFNMPIINAVSVQWSKSKNRMILFLLPVRLHKLGSHTFILEHVVSITFHLFA